MGWFHSLFLQFSASQFFYAGMCGLQRHAAPSLHLSSFLWKTFLLPNIIILCHLACIRCIRMTSGIGETSVLIDLIGVNVQLPFLVSHRDACQLPLHCNHSLRWRVSCLKMLTCLDCTSLFSPRAMKQDLEHGCSYSLHMFQLYNQMLDQWIEYKLLFLTISSTRCSCSSPSSSGQWRLAF